MNPKNKGASPRLQIAARLASLRAAARLSLDQLAERSGLTKSYLSKLERGLSEPSISSVSRLADAFEIGVAEMLGDTVSDEGFRVLPKDDHRALSISSAAPLFELLHGDNKPGGSRLSVYIQHPQRLGEDEGETLPRASHPGEEFIYVLSGKVRLHVADKRAELAPGDGAWYRAELVHKLYSLEKRRADVLIVTCDSVDRARSAE
jgi:transcriptional regulator with XRE-family HTH domain